MDESVGLWIVRLLTAAWMAPLAGFVVTTFALRWTQRLSPRPSLISLGCISLSAVLSFVALALWLSYAPAGPALAHEHHEPLISAANVESVPDHSATSTATQVVPGQRIAKTVLTGDYYRIADFGSLHITVNYAVDSLTVLLFFMVSGIATLIQLFSREYLADELTEAYLDHEAAHAHHSHETGHAPAIERPGRQHRFFASMSLFCFSMLGLILAGNLLQVFVFWELVGLCSYLLIGFYYERAAAVVAANKAFLVNRVGDVGFVIGLAIIWSLFGTFQFEDTPAQDGHAAIPGLWTQLYGPSGTISLNEAGDVVRHATTGDGPAALSYSLLAIAGLGLLAGCLGKSAQFPLQTWLPDAMQGPTPVSALVHSATMVAAGVYLASRIFPLLLPECLLVLAYIGTITLFSAATMAVVATDIKQVLAFSTVSQLGFMMLSIGVGAWEAALFHLVTHACFKSLLFLGAGSVIHACHHEQDMRKMGGLMRRLPLTAATMLVASLAISGLAIPFIRIFGEPPALSGFHSKDAMLSGALAFVEKNPSQILLVVLPLVTAGMTAFYTFRLWIMVFAGEPRNDDVYYGARPGGWKIGLPLTVLAVLAAFVGIGGESGTLYRLIMSSTVVETVRDVTAGRTWLLHWPGEGTTHSLHGVASQLAMLAGWSGFGLAYVIYSRHWISAESLAARFPRLHRFCLDRWRFDEFYDVLLVRPVGVLARRCAGWDRRWLDGILHRVRDWGLALAKWDRLFDERVLDHSLDQIGVWTWNSGRLLRHAQSGRLRQYVLVITAGVVALFVGLMALLPG